MSMDLGRVATITNITNESFTHRYAGQPFTIEAGESLIYPYDLARHLAKHLARKILFSDAKPEQLRNDRALYTKETEDDLVGKILGEESRQELPPELSEQELLKRRIEELNAKKPEGAPAERTKADVIADLEAMGEPVDKRMSLQKLEEQLKKARSPQV